jgi:hypothetical protein
MAKDHSSIDMRLQLRKRIDPDEVIDTMLLAMRDPTASSKDRLAACKLIMDRRDGLPVATVLTAFADPDRAFGDLSDQALAELEKTFAAAIATGARQSQEEETDEDE